MSTSYEATPGRLAHQFDSLGQQFQAGKLGMWLLLATEVLFFSGLFCAYTVCRAGSPEVFEFGHYFLDLRLGFSNTCLLLCSSLTAALAVRFAQRAERIALVLAVLATLACGAGFLGIKAVEYSRDVEERLLPGAYFAPTLHVWQTRAFRQQHPDAAALADELRSAGNTATAPVRLTRERTARLGPLLRAGVIGPRSELLDFPSQPRNAHLFFGLYFLLTGLHGVHVVVGMGVWSWLLLKALRGQFGGRYWAPVEFAALYWHLVDVVWIYLFPLVYLIH